MGSQITRLDGWVSRLYAAIEAADKQPYVLGSHDCFRLACRVVEALTGIDRWPEFSGYRTKREAMAIIASHGTNFEEAFDWFFGAQNIDIKQARRGDICAVQTEDGEKHLGICVGRTTAVLGADGLIYMETLDCLCAWRIG